MTPTPGHRSALVVAVGAYEDEKLNGLRAPLGDADALGEALGDPSIGDFEVRQVVNQPSWVMAEEIESFLADRHRDDLLVLYLSCHGVKDVQGRLYFAATNTKVRRLAATGISSQFVNELMNRCRSRRIVLLLDCCYSGAFTGMATKSDGAMHVQERFDGHGRIVLTASDAMQYAFEGERVSAVDDTTPSVFTGVLVEGLRTGAADRDDDGRVSVDDLYEYTYDAVRSRTGGSQTPGMLANVHGTIYLARNPRLPGVAAADLDPPQTSPTQTHGARRPAESPTHDSGPRRSAGRRWWRAGAAAIAVIALTVVAVYLGTRNPPENPAAGWTRLPDLPQPLEAGATTTHDGGIWVAGGISPEADRHKLTDVQVFDPEKRSWSKGPELPVALSHAALVSNGPQLYLLGGWSSVGAENAVYRLDDREGAWVPDQPLPAPRTAGAAAWDGSRIVFAGGVAPDQQASADVWALQDGAWRTLAPLQVGREKLAAATDSNGTVWFIGGRDRNRLPEGLFGAVDEVTSASTRPLGEATEAVEAPGAVWWPGAGPCVLGGFRRDGFSDAVGCLRPVPDEVQLPRLPEARAGLGAAVHDGTVYVLGGYNGGEHGTGHAYAFPT